VAVDLGRPDHSRGDGPSRVRRSFLLNVLLPSSPQHNEEDDYVTVRIPHGKNGSVGYGEVKRQLLELMRRTFCDARERYSALLDDRTSIDAVLTVGAEAARQAAAPVLQLVRRAVGVAPLQ
jgi:tryptophanyl-tRNA synthetase